MADDPHQEVGSDAEPSQSRPHNGGPDALENLEEPHPETRNVEQRRGDKPPLSKPDEASHQPEPDTERYKANSWEASISHPLAQAVHSLASFSYRGFRSIIIHGPLSIFVIASFALVILLITHNPVENPDSVRSGAQHSETMQTSPNTNSLGLDYHQRHHHMMSRARLFLTIMSISLIVYILIKTSEPDHVSSHPIFKASTLLLLAAMILPTEELVRVYLLASNSDKKFEDFFPDEVSKSTAEPAINNAAAEVLERLEQDDGIAYFSGLAQQNPKAGKDVVNDRKVVFDLIYRELEEFQYRQQIRRLRERGAWALFQNISDGNLNQYYYRHEHHKEFLPHLSYLRSEGVITFQYDDFMSSVVTDLGHKLIELDKDDTINIDEDFVAQLILKPSPQASNLEFKSFQLKTTLAPDETQLHEIRIASDREIDLFDLRDSNQEQLISVKKVIADHDGAYHYFFNLQQGELYTLTTNFQRSSGDAEIRFDLAPPNVVPAVMVDNQIKSTPINPANLVNGRGIFEFIFNQEGYYIVKIGLPANDIRIIESDFFWFEEDVFQPDRLQDDDATVLFSGDLHSGSYNTWLEFGPEFAGGEFAITRYANAYQALDIKTLSQYNLQDQPSEFRVTAGPNNKFIHLTGLEHGNYNIFVEIGDGSSGDPYFTLFNATEGKVIAEDDDAGLGYNAYDEFTWNGKNSDVLILDIKWFDQNGEETTIKVNRLDSGGDDQPRESP